MTPAPILRSVHRCAAVLLLCLLSLLPFGGDLPGSGVPPAEARHGGWDQGLPHQPTDWNDPSGPGPCEGPFCDPCTSTRSPVYIPTGHFIWRDLDLVLPGRPAIGVIRTYNSHDARDGLFGNGWTMDAEIGLFRVRSDGATQYILRLSNGKRYVYQQDSAGTITAPAGRFDMIELQEDGTLHLVDQDASRRVFDTAGRVILDRDPNGRTRHYTYDEAAGLPSRIADDLGRLIMFGYNMAGRVADVTDHARRRWLYDYDMAGNLVSVTDPLGGVTQYAYEPYQAAGDGHTYQHLVGVTDPAGVVVTEVVYDGERVQSYTAGENRYTYAYDSANRRVTRTDSANSRWTYVYNDGGLIVRETDPLSHTVAYAYDANGRMTSVTDELGKSSAIPALF
jgi:YD repeat-containing protein